VCGVCMVWCVYGGGGGVGAAAAAATQEGGALGAKSDVRCTTRRPANDGE
jgi:hypothetical protein